VSHRAETQGTAARRGRTRWVVAALAGACTWSQPALHAWATTPPPAPIDVEVGPEHRLFRVEHAVGTQNYICLPSSADPSVPYAWELFGPQATLFDKRGRQTMTHFQSPNPEENGTLRPEWQDSRDTSAVWAKRTGLSSDPEYVEPDAIPWLRLEVVGRDAGPGRGRGLARASYIQRLNTVGGKAPATGCTEAGHVGHREYVPYEADYFFYRTNLPLD
jgi:hypothetical protein